MSIVWESEETDKTMNPIVKKTLRLLTICSLLCIGFVPGQGTTDIPFDPYEIKIIEVEPEIIASPRAEYVSPQPDPVQVPEISESIRVIGQMRITVYGPPSFPKSNGVSRWIGRSRDDIGFKVSDALQWASELGLDGICAASPGMGNLYYRHREIPPVILEIEGHGRYLLVDRTANWVRNTIDIWTEHPHPGGTYFCEKRKVREVLK